MSTDNYSIVEYWTSDGGQLFTEHGPGGFGNEIYPSLLVWQAGGIAYVDDFVIRRYIFPEPYISSYTSRYSYIEAEAVVEYNWIGTVATTLNVSVTNTMWIMASFITVLLVLISLIATRGQNIFGPLVVTFFCMIVFTIIGWFDLWVMIVFLLLIAGIYANKMKDWLGGGD